MKSSAYSLTSVDNLNSFYFYKKTLINPFSDFSKSQPLYK